jgi:hypothetical protein
MSDDEIRITIAEKCGRNGWWCPQCKVLVSEYSLGYQNRHSNCTDSARQSPDYPNDLNAIQAEVKKFNLPTLQKFSNHLKAIVEDRLCVTSAVDARYMTLQADAAWWCEAFIKTVCPEKWKGNE